MFEQAFKNIDDVLWKEAGCTTELDYTEQSSWLLFLKYLDGLEQDKATEAALDGKKYTYILDKPYRWESEFFKDEAELRAIWSAPDTRKKLLQGLAEKGFGGQQLAEMQKIIDAERSDLFDVLAHVAYRLNAGHARRTGSQGQARHQHALQSETASLPRFRPVALCERRRGRT